MAEIIILVVLYLMAAAAGSNDFSLFLIFACLIGLAIRRLMQSKKDDQRWEEMRLRLQGVEKNQLTVLSRLQKIEQQGVAPIEPRPAAPRPAAPPTPPPIPVPAPVAEKIFVPEPPVIPVAPAPPPAPTPPPPAVVPPVVSKPPEPPRITPVPVVPPRPTPPPAPAPSAQARITSSVGQPPPMTRPAAPPPITPPAPPKKSSRDFEAMLGTNWLGKLGTVLLVFGLAFFLAYAWDQIPPIGKILIGFLSAGLLLGGGVFLEKKGDYQNLAFAGIGGGWATAFFTTFAMYHLKGSQVIQSQTLDLILLLVVAGAMIAHTLRYRSQVVTAMAFLLAFSTITLGHDNTVYSLTAGAILAASLVVLVWKYQWYELEVLGILASYLNHFYWLRPIVELQGKAAVPFMASSGILVLYWLAFRTSYLVRRIDRPEQENVSTLAALLNTSLLLAVMKYQSMHPEWAFWVLLVLGAVELTLGQLPITRKRRMAFLMLSIIGASLMVAAIPFRYSGSQLSVLWLVEAEVLLLAGVLAREALFRWFGMLTALLTSAHILATQYSDAGANREGAILMATAAVLFFGDSLVIPKRWEEALESKHEADCYRVLSYIGFLMAAMAIWSGVAPPWIAVGWAGLGLLLALGATWLQSIDLRAQATGLLLLGFLRAVLTNFSLQVGASHWNLRVMTVGLVIVFLYGGGATCWLSRNMRSPELRALYNWSAWLLLIALAYYEYPNAWLAVVGIAMAIIFAVVARIWGLYEDTLQSAVLGLLVYVRVISMNVDATTLFHGMTLRLVTIGIVIAGYYALAWLSKKPERQISPWISAMHSWLAAALVMMLAWYELHNPNSVVVAWTVFAVVLFEIGMSVPSQNLRLQSYAVLAGSFARILFVNLNAPAEAGQVSQRLLTVLPLAAAFYYVYFRLTADDASERLGVDRKARVATLLSYLGTATLSLLLYFEMEPGRVAMAWAAMVLLLLASSWALGRRVFLYHGLLLSLAVLGRGVLFNIYDSSLNSLTGAQGRMFTVGAAIALLFSALPLAFQLRDKEARGNWLHRYPHQLLFFVPMIMLTLLLQKEITSGKLTVAWGIEGLLTFLFALAVNVRSFRLTGLGLLLLCVGKIVVFDVWGLGARDRYLTLMVLGALLIGVSFLYARYKEKIQRLL